MKLHVLLFYLSFLIASGVDFFAQAESFMTLQQSNEKQTLFEFIMKVDSPRLVIRTNSIKWINKSRLEKYEPATIEIYSGRQPVLKLDGRIRARGNQRKNVCYYPPVKIDFKKSILDSLGFLKQDKLKLVLPCRSGLQYQDRLYSEFLVYRMYHHIDPDCLQVRLLDIECFDGTRQKLKVTGFLIEEESQMERRLNCKIIESSKVHSSALDRQSFARMMFFQYMIANTDWELRKKHNIEVIGLLESETFKAIPYDFDYAGFVGHSYATPYESLPISTVHQRYFMPYEMTNEEFLDALHYYKDLEDDIYRICNDANYLSAKTRKRKLKYLSGFFKLLDKPDYLRKQIVFVEE